jgi:predicted negative regulator of RcsB-dependent stress response
MEPNHVETTAHLIRDGGSVLIAVVVIMTLLYLGWRFIILPGMKQQTAMAKANEEAARQHAIAAKAIADAARANEATSESNARTAAHLERLTEMLLTAAIRQKN